MIRALYNSASGMRAQQINIDVISNNISNASTVGFKKSRLSFKDTLYTEIERRSDETQYVRFQVGSGVKIGDHQRLFGQGVLQKTDNPLDLAIQGPGFFVVRGADGNIKYTRDGSFKLSYDGSVYQLVTANGDRILDEEGNPVEFRTHPDGVAVSGDGVLFIKNGRGEVLFRIRLAIAGFANPQGLRSVGDGCFVETPSSGIAGSGPVGTIKQGFLEMSNVEILDEVTKLIMAQRAYQLNSRVLQTADEMEKLANNLPG